MGSKKQTSFSSIPLIWCLYLSIFIIHCNLHKVCYFTAGYTYQKDFTWDAYLIEVANNIPAPYELFTSVCFFVYILQTIVISCITNVQSFAGLT